MNQSHFSARSDFSSEPASELFLYEDGCSTRTWRPDLVPHIIAWLDAVPAATLAKLVRVGVSDVGGFVATFDVGLSYMQVFVEFDDPEAMAVRTIGDAYEPAGPVTAFDPSMIDIAAARGAELEAAERLRLQHV
jgi:hypothetical protein